MNEFRVKIVSDIELIRKDTFVTVIGEHGKNKYRVRTPKGLSVTVNKKNCELV